VSRHSLGLSETVRSYLQGSHSPEHAELYKLRETTSKLPDARMQIAPEQGHLLAFLVRLIGAKRTLEIGTFTGYSALAVALALPQDGQVVACEINQEWANIGREHWLRAGVAEKINLRIGPADVTLKLMQQAEPRERFDLAFIDADKESYDCYYEAALDLVRPGGLIVLDNVLLWGRVADFDETDLRTSAIRSLNAKVAVDDRVDRVMLAVCDGMTLVRRRH
jgi:O-methyltransferase